MLQKIIFSCVLTTMLMVGSAFAAPSVKKLGANMAHINNNASVVKQDAKPAAPVAQPRVGSVRATNLALTTPKAAKPVTTESGSAARLSLGKYIHSTGVASGQIVSNASTASSNDLVEINDRLNDLSDQVITGVEESGTGSYISGVVVDGNTLTVTKTDTLVAPVKNANRDNVSGTAEIWIVR